MSRNVEEMKSSSIPYLRSFIILCEGGPRFFYHPRVSRPIFSPRLEQLVRSRSLGINHKMMKKRMKLERRNEGRKRDAEKLLFSVPILANATRTEIKTRKDIRNTCVPVRWFYAGGGCPDRRRDGCCMREQNPTPIHSGSQGGCSQPPPHPFPLGLTALDQQTPPTTTELISHPEVESGSRGTGCYGHMVDSYSIFLNFILFFVTLETNC